MTPAAANRFFGTIYFDYTEPSWGVDRLRLFWHARARGRALSGLRHRCDLRLDQHLDRARFWRMDAEGPALKAFRSFLLLALLLPQFALAHVGSKDVFQQVTAGPYKLFVTVRMPNVIPGVANVEIRSTGAQVSALQIAPLPLAGEASKHPPTPDAMKASTVDPNFFTGGVWMMSAGSMQVRIQVTGAAGDATVSVPVPAVAVATLQMQRELGIPLALLGLFLVISMAGAGCCGGARVAFAAGRDGFSQTAPPRARSNGRHSRRAGTRHLGRR